MKRELAGVPLREPSLDPGANLSIANCFLSWHRSSVEAQVAADKVEPAKEGQA